MTEMQFDLVVIGSGPGGYVAAIRASQLGLKTAIMERDALGGICLNWGCIPTKALLRTAEIQHLIHHAKDFGLSAKSEKPDWKKIISRSRDVSQQLSNGIAHLMKKNKITVIHGTARLNGKQGALHKVTSVHDKKETTVMAQNVILATGARARSFPGLEFDGQNIWSAKEAMTAPSCPTDLLIIGSGAIGIEFASFYNAMGAKVTVVEALDRILPAEDKEISKLAHKSFEKQGIEILTSVKVTALKSTKSGVEAEIETASEKKTLKVEKALLAIGVVGNTENLGLEKTKIKIEKGQIKVNPFCLTDEPNIYAIGDVAGAPWLAHKASHEGILAVEHMAGHKVHALKRENIPGCTYCHPQIASVGLTEDKARDAGYTVKIGRFPSIGNGKSIAIGETDGLVKVIFDAKTGELLGAHMIGAEVTEQIQGFVIAKTAELTEAELMHTIFPHPTISEMMHESVLSAYDRVIHM